MSYGQHDRYSYPDRQNTDGYSQNHQQYPDEYQYNDGHGQNYQYADRYGQSRQNSVDAYGVYPGQPPVRSDRQDSVRPGQQDAGPGNYGEKYLDIGDEGDASNMNAPFPVKGSPALSEAKLLVPPGSAQKPRKPRSCWYYPLCKCWPRWARFICCACLLIVLGLVVAVAIIAATFKVPSITLNGVTTQPGVDEFVQNGTSFSFNFALEIGVVNDNIIGATFQKIKAAAFYPIDQTPVGGGELNNVNFPSHATTNLTFPFSIVYDPMMDKDQAVVNDIASRCGLLGGAKQPIVVTYTVTLYLRIIFVTITPPPIKQKTSIDCPIQDGQLPSFAQGMGITPSNIGLPPSTPTPTSS